MSPLTAALRAWSAQGPALLDSALAAKDAEIARLKADHDAHVSQIASLRACVRTLQSAVDQLVALCHAQVDELASFDTCLTDRPPVAVDPAEPAQREGDDHAHVPQSARCEPCVETPGSLRPLHGLGQDLRLIEDSSPLSNDPASSSVHVPWSRAEAMRLRGGDTDVGDTEKDAEVWSDDAVAVWDDGTSAAESMERYVVDERGSARLPILACAGSQFVDVHEGECVIKEAAFVADEHLPCVLTVTKAPDGCRWSETSFVNFEYPDGTRLPFVPVCGVRVRGEGEGEGLLEGSEGYGEEFVRVVVTEEVHGTLVGEAGRALEDVWPDVVMQKGGVRCEGGIEFTARLMGGGCQVWDKGWEECAVSDVLGRGDLTGDATLMLRFVDRFGIAELDFVLHRMQVREGG